MGQFIFPKLVLYEKGYISYNGHGGKRAMRVYPPWDNPESVVAKKTQKWQLNYFVEINSVQVEVEKIQTLFKARD